MALKPIFVVTHPRSCSTAFERAFMTWRDLRCIHEPFGEAFYFGPERMSPRFLTHNGDLRESDKSKTSTYGAIVDSFKSGEPEGPRLFLKDMAYHFSPHLSAPASIAPSLVSQKKGLGTSDLEASGKSTSLSNNVGAGEQDVEAGNPTVIPRAVLESFHFSFLIRHPRYSLPSSYRCTISPLVERTKFHEFYPSEAGYRELRKLFDFVRSFRNTEDGKERGDICVIDADDLLNKPAEVVEKFCNTVGLPFDPAMLTWDSEEEHERAKHLFAIWAGWHDDALHSTGLRPRTHPKTVKSEDEEDAEWSEKFGDAAAKVIRETVDASLEDYVYMKQFAMAV